uniref:Ataxin 2-like n=1 Tax=Mastacembelus armatus TaxID=205130 RepID=A0A7N8WW64_9TELE
KHPVFEGVYNNARMLHFLTAVVGSTCDVRVKNGTVYEGIFKTLSSQCELAVDAVHKLSDGDGGGGGEEGGGENHSSLPRIEDITDTMIFSPTDLVTMTCRDVDLNFAVRDTFSDTAIGSSRVNGEHKEKVLQRWDEDGIGENFELESDTSNGWDANEMFKFNEEAYGVKSTYDSSLSMYTMPLERGNSEVYRQREARATRLASEIECSQQFRRRVSLENDENRSEEEKYSSVAREREDKASPGFSSASREGKYIPLPQRAREIGLTASSMRGGASSRTAPPTSSRHPPPSSSSPKPPSDRSSPLFVRNAYSPHQTQSSPPAASSPPCTSHLPHSLSHPQALADTTCSPVNGVASRTSPKSQRIQNSRNLRTPNSQSSSAVSRAAKPDASPQDLPLVSPGFLDVSPSTVTTATTTTKPSGPTPLFPVDCEILFSLYRSAIIKYSEKTFISSTFYHYFNHSYIKIGITGFSGTHTFNNLNTAASTPTPPRPTPPAPAVVLPPPGQPGGGAIYSSPPGHYLSYISPIPIHGHSIQSERVTLCSAVSGPVVGARPEHHTSPAAPMISAAASAAGPPLVASPYPQSYLQYGQVIQAMSPHYHSQPVYSMLQGGARMLTSGAPPQPMGPPGHQYPGQAEGPPGPPQAMYAPQSFSHHSGSIHPPQPSSTPTGNQPPPQHAAPSPGHSSQGGPQPQSLLHAGGLSAPTPPNLPPGHSSPQASYTMQGYSLPTHQPLPHGFPSISQLTQAHVTGAMSGPHHAAGHGPPPVMLHYAHPQQGSGSNPQHGPPPQQGAPQHFYIGPPQVQVQAHPTQQLSFHPSAN